MKRILKAFLSRHTEELEKTFDLLDHNFLMFSLAKYGFGKISILLIFYLKILLRDQESCVKLKTVQLQKNYHLGEEPVKVTQF